jgi:signal transduction histidine kinase
VARTGLLDTPPEETFDRLTRLAARLLGVPSTFISLVDERRDFYKSCVGFGEPLASARQLEGGTFCHYAIVSDGPLLIDDTTLDPVFRAVPTVTSLGVRAYAGIPLVTDDGDAIGSFCAIDFKPRAWSELDIEVLTELAHAAMREIKMRFALEDTGRALREAQDSARGREEVLAAIMHDLRTPLGVITMNVHLLESAATPEQMVALARMRRAVESTARLADDLLDMGRLNAGALEARPQPVDGRQLLEDAAAMLSPLAARQEVALETAAEPELGAVLADYQLLLRVFTNLVGNAVKFSPPGSKVRLSAAGEGRFLRYTVADRGPGIAPDQVAHVFDRYWQAKDRDARGLGLGLAIVRSIVEAHGGEVRVDSTVGEGSRFSFTIPRG